MNVNDDFMAKVLEDSAWEELSEWFGWSELLLEKFQEKVHWKKISENGLIIWTASMLEKFKKQIDWDLLSLSAGENILTLNNLEKYRNYWNWTNLSSNRNISFSLDVIDQFARNWNWGDLIMNYRLSDLFCEDFLNKYSQYIPPSSLQHSNLWKDLVEKRKNDLIRKVILA